MTECIMLNTQVRIMDGIGIDDSLSRMIHDFIERRLTSPLVAFKQDNVTCIRLATAEERKKYTGCASRSVQLKDRTGRIYTIGGLKPNQLTDEDISFAVRLWYEPVIVEKGQDGTPWIDD